MKSTVNIVIISVGIMINCFVSIKMKFTVSIKKLTVNIMIIAVSFMVKFIVSIMTKFTSVS